MSRCVRPWIKLRAEYPFKVDVFTTLKQGFSNVTFFLH